MKRIELWLWLVPSETRPGRMARTRHRMTKADARAQYGEAAQRIEGTLETREVPETPEEALRSSTGQQRP